MSIINHLSKARRYEEYLRRTVPEEAQEAFQTVLTATSDDPAFVLMCTSPNDLRGVLVLWLFHLFQAGEIRQGTFRCALEACWDHDYGILLNTIREDISNPRRFLRSMFERAGFPMPRDVPSQVDIWRGTNGISARTAKRGIAWTTDYDVACWFAMRFAHGSRIPLVLKATVPPADVIFLTTSEESEVIYFDGTTAEIDGTEEGWREADERVQRARREKQLALHDEWQRSRSLSVL